jgi:hypothetical protein
MSASVTASSEALLVGNAARTEASGSTTAVEALAVNTAVSQYLAETGITLTGAGLKIGILSDSFDITSAGALTLFGDGETGDIANGLLPPKSDIHIIEEGPFGSADEGRAMAQEVYAIAPGAQIYFYSAEYSATDFANGIETLAADGCNVIVDDVSYEDEPFYQDTGAITQAIETVVSEGVSYFTAAGNSFNNFYEAAFQPMSFNLPGIGTELTNNVAGGSPYEAVSLSGGNLDMTLEWTQPFGDSQYDLGAALYSYNGTSYTLVKNFTTHALGGDPELLIETGLRNVAAGTYYLAFYESSAEPNAPAPGIFKIISFEDSDATIDGTGAGVGSGTSIGHELTPGANTVAAVNVAETPAAGVTVPVVESYSAAGPGITYYNAGGTLLSTPVVDGTPQFAATDGSQTSVFDPFDGTSAAAPNAGAVALLMLQADARLTPAQVTYLLERSAISTGDSITGGAGLIQADTAVAGAHTAATMPIWTAQDNTTLWTDGLNWSDSAVPTATSSVEITDGLGIFTGAYEIVFNESAASVAALDVGGGIYTGALPELTIQATDTLETGSLTLGAGTIFLAGTLDDSGALAAGSSTGEIEISTGGILELGGGAAGEKISFSGSGGDLWLGTANAGTLRGGLLMDITGFSAGDTIDLAGLAVSQVNTVKVAGTVASVLGNSSQVLASLSVSGEFSGLAFANDGVGGTEIYAACFAEGTRILTACGAQVAVEELVVGDSLALFSGAAAPIIWIGRRKILLRRHKRPGAVQPVLISAGAIGHGLPARDLVVSPDHALYLRGRLIPAKALINGFSIRQLNRESVTYYHVELPEHGVIFAEGAGAESYLETGNRGAFKNEPGIILHPDFAQGLRETNGCAPFAEHGPVVEAVRRDIWRRAGIAMTDEPDVRVEFAKGAAIIASRAVVPGEILPDPRDRRRLGVKIGELMIGRRKIPLGDARLCQGWHEAEPDGRWTDGAAVIPAALLGRSRDVRLTLAAVMRYPVLRIPEQETGCEAG